MTGGGGGRRKTRLSIVRNARPGELRHTPSRVMDGFEVHIQFLDHLKRLNAYVRAQGVYFVAHVLFPPAPNSQFRRRSDLH